MDFVVGDLYNRRQDIHAKYQGQRQGGISISKNHNLIFIFSSETGQEYGYRDHFHTDGTFRYTAEGQQGDILFTNQKDNLALVNHSKNNK